MSEPTYEDREHYTMFDVQYEATNQEANDLRSYLGARAEMHEFDAIEAMLQHGTFAVHEPLVFDKLQQLANRRAVLLDRLHGLTRVRAREMGLVS